jgi:hypothetical protein
MRRALVLLLVMLVSLPGTVTLSRAQGWAGSDAKTEPRSLIDIPTAGLLRGGEKSFQVDFYRADGLQAAFNYGITDRLLFGLAYGGTRIIGTSPPEWNEVPGFLVKVRVLEESASFPALVIGFDSEGAEGYIGDRDRFTIKSPGLYLVMSKNYDASGFLGFHGGCNYSLEKSDGDKDLNLFFGIDKTLGSFLSLIAEYSAGFNDNGARSLSRGRGYLNAGIAASPGAGISIALHFKDLFENQPHEGFANRTLRIDYAR